MTQGGCHGGTLDQFSDSAFYRAIGDFRRAPKAPEHQKSGTLSY